MGAEPVFSSAGGDLHSSTVSWLGHTRRPSGIAGPPLPSTSTCCPIVACAVDGFAVSRVDHDARVGRRGRRDARGGAAQVESARDLGVAAINLQCKARSQCFAMRARESARDSVRLGRGGVKGVIALR